jgi:hypothetical protein
MDDKLRQRQVELIIGEWQVLRRCLPHLHCREQPTQLRYERI